MWWIKLRQKNVFRKEGQAMIEFSLGLMIVISFFFFYIKLAAILAIGNYIHYATFMAARAYASSTQTLEMQNDSATAVLTTMLGGRWKSLIKQAGSGSISGLPGATIGQGPWYQEDPIRNNWNQGVTFTFKPTLLTFFPSSTGGEKLDFTLTSESWMSREDSEDEINAKKNQIKNIVNVPNVNIEWDEL